MLNMPFPDRTNSSGEEGDGRQCRKKRQKYSIWLLFWTSRWLWQQCDVYRIPVSASSTHPDHCCTAATSRLRDDLTVTLPYRSSLRDSNCEWSVSKQALHCQKTWHSISIVCEYQWDAPLDFCCRRTFMPGRNCSLVKCSQAAEYCLASFLHIGYRTLATADSTFHSLSLSLRIKKMDDCIQALTGKAYTWPVGTLLHSFMHKDFEIADCFFLSCECDTSTHKQICSLSCDVPRPRLIYSFVSICFGDVVRRNTGHIWLHRTRKPAAHYR